jgi:ribosomal protein L37AE/L43A/predicted nuclease with TOPRIM domain
MGAEEQNRNEILSRIVADLSAKSKVGEELSAKIHRLRDEIKKVIENEDTIFGKIRGLVDSFREIIPEEKQRYSAAIKALTATSKLSQQEIVKAVTNQLGELKILEKGLLSALPNWRDELKAMEAKSQETKAEISKLREVITRLENEEKGLQSGISAREKEMERIEKAVGEIFTEIGADITYIKIKIEEFSAESAAPQPIPPKASIKSNIPAEAKATAEQKNEIHEPSSPQYTEFQKKCPMCGGRMDFYSNEKMWRCYSCANEELEQATGSGEQKSETREPSAPKQDTEFQKKCPMCGGQMNFLMNENMWLCYACAHEERAGEVQGKSEESERTKMEITTASEPIFDRSPLRSSDIFPEPKKASHHQPPPKKKTCPSCRKKMNWNEDESIWRCPFCEYERRI